MNLADIQKSLLEDRKLNTITIYMPSIKSDLTFRSLTTEDLKVLSRISMYNDFDLNNELLKLGLFDKLLVTENVDLKSSNLLIFDYLAFIIALRKLLNNDLIYEFTCQACEQKFQNKLDLETEFSNYIFGFEPKVLYFEKLDNSNNIWKFELTNFTVKNYFYYRYYIERLKEIDINSPDLLNEEKFIRPILYISKIFKNDEEITDWGEQLFGAKIKFYNLLPAELTLDSTGIKDSDDFLSSFVKKNFDEEHFIEDISKIDVICPNEKCKQVYSGLYSFDDFFTF